MQGNRPVPRYKESAVAALYEMAGGSGASGKDLSLLIEDMKEKESAYKAEAKSLEGVLKESLGLSLSGLSKEATNCLDVLVSSAMALETKDTSLTSFFSAINDMTLELYATEAKNKEMELEVTKMREKLTAVLLLEERLKEDVKKTEEHLEIEEVKADNREHNLDFLRRKSVDIESRIRATEEQITATGLDQSLTHEALMSLSEKVAGLQQETASLQKKLESYLNLPPSLPLARVKIEEAKRELKVVEAELSKEIEKLDL